MFRNILFIVLFGLISNISILAANNFQVFQNNGNPFLLSTSFQEDDFELGTKAFTSGDYELAVFYYTRYLKAYPNAENAYYNRGLSYNYLKKFDLAIIDFNKVIEIDPQYWKAYSSRGYSYQSLNKCTLAIPEFTRSIEINPNDNISYQNRGLCYQTLGKPDLAEADFIESARIKSGGKKPETPKTPPVNTGSDQDFDLGLKALLAKNYEQAVAYYTRYLSKYPNNPDAYYNRGLANYSLQKTDSAVYDYTKALELNPKYVNAYINRGLTFAKQGNTDLAIRDYTSAILIDPNNKLAYQNRGVTYKEIGKTALADADFAKVAQLETGTTNTGGNTGGGNSILPKTATNSSGIIWKPVVEMNSQIFPSFYLATATIPIEESKDPYVIGDSHGKIGLHIRNPQKNTKIKIGIHLDPIISYQEFEATLSDSGEVYLIFPKVIWNWEALKKYKKATPANATFTLFVNGTQVDKQNIVVRIRSINEAVYAYRFIDNEKWADTGYLFAAYVNEDHEWIDKLLREALDTRLVDAFLGYQGGPNGVRSQVFAIWFILQRRGFKYSSITDTSGTGATNMVYSQYVRLFDEAIGASQANCVDGSVLIASILKKIGINVGLVLIPGHCFLVFDMDGKGDLWGLETTAIGNIDLRDFEGQDKLTASLANFKKAMEIGDQRLKESLEKIKAGDARYNLVSINKARKDGINPISW